MDYIWNQFSQLAASNQFLQGGMVLGILTWLGYQLKSVPVLIWNKFRYYATYTVHFDETSEFYRVFSEWLHDKHPKKFRNVEVRFNRRLHPDDNGPRPADDPYKPELAVEKFQFNDSNVLFYQGRWLWVTKNRKELNTVSDIRSLFYNNYSISGLFAKSAVDALCEEILQRKVEESKDDGVTLWTDRGNYWSNKALKITKDFSHLFFNAKKELLADLDTFLSQRAFYAEKGINYKRSYLLYGRGGTGKTSIATALAKHLNYGLYVLNLAAYEKEDEFQRICSYIPSKAVILLEDIDCVLQDRDVKGDDLNFSTILNFLDGVYAPSDCVFVLTTNKPDSLDAALIRKGRVDLALHIDYPDAAEVEAFMSDFYDQDVQIPMFFERRANGGMAEVQDICLRNPVIKDAVNEVMKIFIETNGKSETVGALRSAN